MLTKPQTRFSTGLRGLLTAALIVTAASATPAHAITDEEVGQAIDRIKKFLYDQQDAQGGWDSSLRGHSARFLTGNTAIVVMALLYAGESVHHPKLAKAIQYLEENEGDGVYAVGLRAHVWAALPARYDKHLKAEARWLKECQIGSLFDYFPSQPRPGASPGEAGRIRRIDHSATQYGILGLWEYQKRNGDIAPAFWENAIAHFINFQHPDGGWDYNSQNGASYGSMTTAGLTVLYLAQQQARRSEMKADENLAKAIERGMAWLDKNFGNGSTNPGKGQWLMYYLYGIERVALASGIKNLNGRDWYETGATTILQQLRGGGSVGNISDTAFALAFLARGRVPVWINKLKVEGQAWNERPNDIYFWNKSLTDETERRLNWQVIDADWPAEQWLTAPVTYVSSSMPLQLSDAQKQNLKDYLDMGGVLLAVNGGGAPFANSIRALGRELYPGLTLRRARPGHDLIYTATYNVSGASHPIEVLSNGARDLIYVVHRDWGIEFQKSDPLTGDTAKLATNFFTIATDRARLDNRLETLPRTHIEDEAGADAAVTIGRATYSGRWNVEPLAWRVIGRNIRRHSGVAIQTQDVPLVELASFPHRFVHLAGVEPKVKLTDAELAAIKAYAEAGGTLLIETVGGKTGFDREISGQLQRTLNMSPVDEIPPDHPFISGQGFKGGSSAFNVQFTPSLATRIRVGSSPRFRAFYINNRPAIILSSEDLTLAAMNVRQWGIIGYSRESALQLLTNLVLYSSTADAGAAEAEAEAEAE